VIRPLPVVVFRVELVARVPVSHPAYALSAQSLDLAVLTTSALVLSHLKESRSASHLFDHSVDRLSESAAAKCGMGLCRCR
jgi:hypothetical protein